MGENVDRLEQLREASTSDYLLCFVHGDLHGDNIMIDAKDNRFLIDFGKTGIGHCLEDVTWLESFIMLSYTELVSDDELAEVLNLVPALAPARGIDMESCGEAAMSKTISGKLRSPRI